MNYLEENEKLIKANDYNKVFKLSLCFFSIFFYVHIMRRSNC